MFRIETAQIAKQRATGRSGMPSGTRVTSRPPAA